MMKFNATTPIYIQIAGYVTQNIQNGQWAEGDRIPSVRELGSLLGVNPHTCVRAYELLITKGILNVQRGMGHIVCVGAVTKIYSEARKEFINETLYDMIAEMKRLNITLEDFTITYNSFK